MTLCDSNVWLALALSAHAHHTIASEWFDTVDQADSIVFCRASQQTLLRLLTNPAVLAPYGNRPLTNREAWAVYEAFQEDDRIGSLAQEPAGIEPLWRELAVRDSASPKLWMDAYLAAFAVASGSLLVTTDSGFAQFDGLRPLILG